MNYLAGKLSVLVQKSRVKTTMQVHKLSIKEQEQQLHRGSDEGKNNYR